MKKVLKAVNPPARRLESGGVVFPCAPLPEECSAHYAPGMEIGPDGNTGKNLCNPFLRDSKICSGYYWPAQRPDGTVQAGSLQPSNVSWVNLGATFEDPDWENLPVVTPDVMGNPTNTTLWDTLDKTSAQHLSDIYLRDNWNDSGKEPSPGNFWESPDLFFRHQRDDPGAFNTPSTDPHQDPVAGKENWAYVRALNRGARPIDHVFARVYLSAPWSSNPTWTEIGHATGHNIPPGATGTLRCPLPYAPPQPASHACVMAWIESTQDLVKVNAATYDKAQGPRPLDLNVPGDNNAAQRNIKVVPQVIGWGAWWYYVSLGTGLLGEAEGLTDLEFQFINAPMGARLNVAFATLAPQVLTKVRASRGVTRVALEARVFRPEGIRTLAELAGIRGAKPERPINGFTFPAKGRVYLRALSVKFRKGTPVLLDLAPVLPSKIRPPRPFQVVLRQYARGRLLGGITLVVHPLPPDLVRYVADLRTAEFHRLECPQVEKLPERERLGSTHPLAFRLEGLRPSACCEGHGD